MAWRSLLAAIYTPVVVDGFGFSDVRVRFRRTEGDG
jgi:hypothetical protein